eukprot:3873064-Alexandrium_andersonii.AAC.1
MHTSPRLHHSLGAFLRNCPPRFVGISAPWGCGLTEPAAVGASTPLGNRRAFAAPRPELSSVPVWARPSWQCVRTC